MHVYLYSTWCKPFWLHWVFVAVCRLAVMVESRGYSSCRARALDPQASAVAAHSPLAAPWYVGCSWTRDGICVPSIDRRILIHWTTREVPM